MNWFAWLALVVASQVIHQANARAVFAHFMVSLLYKPNVHYPRRRFLKLGN